MRSATRAVTATFGIFAALAAMEHGVGEVLQGDVRPDGLMIQSWPSSAFFRIEAWEPAMTVVPNLLASGVLTLLVALVFLVGVLRFAHRRHGGFALLIVSITLLLVGGGFGPPLLGIIVSLTAMRIGGPFEWWGTRLVPASGHPLAQAWPWVFGACVGAWLMLVPGLPILSETLGVDNPNLVVALSSTAIGLLALTIVSALARDAERWTGASSRATGRLR